MWTLYTYLNEVYCKVHISSILKYNFVILGHIFYNIGKQNTHKEKNQITNMLERY
jgi:hypothetical protein